MISNPSIPLWKTPYFQPNIYWIWSNQYHLLGYSSTSIFPFRREEDFFFLNIYLSVVFFQFQIFPSGKLHIFNQIYIESEAISTIY